MSNPQSQTTEAVCHADLVRLAEGWLWKQNCGVVFRDQFRAVTSTGEQPDAIGFRHGVSILVECKASRADYLADRAKPFRRDPALGVGDWRFFLCPPGMILEAEMPAGWGLLYALGTRVKPIVGMPGNTGWRTDRPFHGKKDEEAYMLYSALRRMVIRGHFNSIYDPIQTGAQNVAA